MTAYRFQFSADCSFKRELNWMLLYLLLFGKQMSMRMTFMSQVHYIVFFHFSFFKLCYPGECFLCLETQKAHQSLFQCFYFFYYFKKMFSLYVNVKHLVTDLYCRVVHGH